MQKIQLKKKSTRNRSKSQQLYSRQSVETVINALRIAIIGKKKRNLKTD